MAASRDSLLVDSHCHLDFPDFDGEREAVIERAREQGVGRFLTIATRLDRLAGVLAVAETHDDVWCTVGVHPHHAALDDETATTDRLVALARHPKVVGLGETGLDYFYDQAPRDIQQLSFRRHLAACRETGLPVVVHTRDADTDTAAILREEGAGRGEIGGVLHCFTGGADLARAALDMGFYISLSGILTFRNSEALRRIAGLVPLDRVLVETDSPYLAPVPKRGKRNEPAFIVHTASVLAAVQGVSPEELAVRTTENFLRLFARATDAVPPPNHGVAP